MLSEVLRAGRASTAGLSSLSTPDSILICNAKLCIIVPKLREPQEGIQDEETVADDGDAVQRQVRGGVEVCQCWLGQ